MARSNGLKRLAIAQLGSNEIDEQIFVKELVLATVRRIVPEALRAAARVNPSHSEALEKHALTCADVKDLNAARAASYAASCAASCASDAASDASCAASCASDAARAASCAASCASDAVSYASYAASCASYAASCASDAASYASDAASYASEKDRILALMADCAVDALIVCKSPGCKWLKLADAPSVGDGSSSDNASFSSK